MGYSKGDRVHGGRAGWTATGTVTGVRAEEEFEPGEERTVFVKWDGGFVEDEMDESEVRPE
jgi:hypothetical protein